MEHWTPEQLQERIAAGDRIFLKLWKKGCGACKLANPAIERIEAADHHGLKFVQIGVDDHPEMLEISDTDVLPAFFVFKDRGLAGQHIGFKGIKSLQDLVARSMGEGDES